MFWRVTFWNGAHRIRTFLTKRSTNQPPRAAYSKMSEQIRLLVSPAKALVDDPVDITVDGLHPGQQVTLYARLAEGAAIYQSYAHYMADDSGRVAAAQQPSVGGLYTGVEKMGLFWSMQPSPDSPLRLRKKDVTTPFLVDISVHEGHVDVMDQDPPPALAVQRVERLYMGRGVTRVPVKEGRIRGTLFLPPGPARKFPGLLELFGVTGDLHEYRAALLASRGFATLALAYVGHGDLPKDVLGIDLDYFEEAADWLLRQPCVQGPGVGALGTSKGGEIVLAMATHFNQVAAAVSIGGHTAITAAPLPYKDKCLPFTSAKLENVTFTAEGFVVWGNTNKDLTEEPGSPAWIQVEKSRCPIMLIAGEDDLAVPALDHAIQAVTRMKVHGKSNYSLVSYAGAGHLIEPPYTPHYRAYKYRGTYFASGGNPKDHAVAQEDSWFKILEFFQEHLGKSGTASKL